MKSGRKRILLIFPPGWTVYSPYLALPMLAAYLRQSGHQVEIRDLNIEFFNLILSTCYLEGLGSSVKRNWRNLTETETPNGSSLTKTGKALVTYDHLVKNVESAKTSLRDKDSFLDQATFISASETIANSLNLISGTCPGVTIALSGITYESKIWRSPNWIGSQNIFNAFFSDYVLPSLHLDDYELVGFSVSSQDQLLPALCFAQAVKSQCPEVSVCMGGGYLTRVLTRLSRLHPWFGSVDAFVLFEGEVALSEYVSCLEDKSRWTAISNLAFQNHGSLQRTAPGPPIDLNELPTPDFEGFPLGDYFAPEAILPTYTSRGCPWNLCSFCTEPFSYDAYRERDLSSVVRDLGTLQNRYSTNLFTFVDESLPLNRMSELCDALAEKSVDIAWNAATRFSRDLDKKSAAKLYKGGCRKLQFGLESYNQRLLNLMRKGIRADWIRPNIENCLAAGISAHLFTIVGFPTETREEAERTLTFARGMVHLSSERYGLDFTTMAVSPFALDIFSDVHNNSARYSIKPRSPGSLGPVPNLVADYDILSGMDQEMIAEVLSEFSNRNVLQEILRYTSRRDIHGITRTMNREEDGFLRHYYQTLGIRNPLPRDMGVILAPDGTETVVIQKDTVLLKSERSWCRERDPVGPFYYFYRGEGDTVLELSGRCDDLVSFVHNNRPLSSYLLDIKSPHLCVNGISLPMNQILVLLLTEGFLECSAVKTTVLEECISRGMIARLKPDVETHFYRERIVLFRYSTGRLIEVHPAVLRQFPSNGRPRTSRDVCNLDIDVSIRAQLAKAAKDLSSAGFIYFTRSDSML